MRPVSICISEEGFTYILYFMFADSEQQPANSFICNNFHSCSVVLQAVFSNMSKSHFILNNEVQWKPIIHILFNWTVLELFWIVCKDETWL